MKISKASIILESKNAGISCNLHDKDREFLIREENGSELVISFDIIKRCINIAELELNTSNSSVKN